MEKDNIINQIKKILPLCFGGMDKVFCTSSRESINARNVLKLLIENDVTFIEFENIVIEFLKSNIKDKKQYDEQLQKINSLSYYLK